MDRSGRALWAIGVLVAAGVVASPALARGDDPERQARRHELRQQLQAERERWRGDERGRGGWPPAAHAPGGAHAVPPGGAWGPAPGGGGAGPAPGYAPPPGYGGGPGWGGGHRLSPDERRALRQDLRQQRP
jgi:hypothetical protein